MSSLKLNQILLFIAVLTAAMWQLYLVDDNLGASWPQNVVRNWQQFGFFTLHGQLISNPGGYQIATAPDVYKGMSPLCLWPAFGLTEAFAWTGLGTLAFHFFLTLSVFWAVWALLGKDNFAFLAAAVVVLCPGYDRWQKLLDPNAISVLLGLPYAAVLVAWMKKPRLRPADLAGVFVVTLAFIALNWTTAWVLGPLMLLLLGLPQVNRRSLGLFVLLAGLGSVLFVGVSMFNKSGGGHGNPGALSLFLRSYLWGNVGYGEGLSTGKAFVLLAFTNSVGLFGLWVLSVGTLAYNRAAGGRALLLSLAPLVLAIMDVVVMRNYFGHHPWMAAPVLLVGLVFSLALLRGRLTGSANSAGFKPAAPARAGILVLFCTMVFAYGLAVLLFFRSNETNTLALLGLIRHHTDRGAAIVIVQKTDPELAQMAARFDELFDRHVVVVPDLPQVPAVGGHPIILSAATLADATLVARNGGAAAGSGSVMRSVSAWFNQNIARRKPGDRLEIGETYFLYEPKP